MRYDFGIVTRKNENQWGGDLKALYTIESGLKNLGYSVRLGQDAGELSACNFIFLSNTCLDQIASLKTISKTNTPYGIIGFHEDFLTYYLTSIGAVNTVKKLVDVGENSIVSLDRIRETPDLVRYFGTNPPTIQLMNHQVLKHATLCVANSPFEMRTMLRDCETANACSVHWTAGFADEWGDDPDESFLELTGLESQQYILQVGRLETRKNQLYTALACKDLGLPLVFIATKGYQPWYEKILKQIGKKYDIDIVLVSENYSTQKSGKFSVIQMPDGKKMPINMLLSGFNHAAVHCSPAFHELPGYTYLESLALGVPTVVSEWTSLSDYLEYKGGDRTCNGLAKYCLPHDLRTIEQLTYDFIKKSPKRVKPTNAIFSRTDTDVAKDLIAALGEHYILD